MSKKNNVLELTARKLTPKKEEAIELEKTLREVNKFFQYKKQFPIKIEVMNIDNIKLDNVEKPPYGFFEVEGKVVAISKTLISNYHAILFGGQNKEDEEFKEFSKSMLLTINNTITELCNYFKITNMKLFEFPELELENNLNHLRVTLMIEYNESQYYAFIFSR